MKTIRKKLLFLILMLVIIASLANSFAGLYATSEVLDSEAEKIMNLMCEQNAAKIDNVFYSIADMVGSLAIRAKAEISDINQLENQAFLEEYTDMLEKSALSYAKEMKGALAFYVAYNPEYTSPTAGFFWKRQKTDQDFVKVPRTDLYAYDKDDIEHVGWYYIPVENQEPTWMMPYNNKNLNEWTISYVVPIYMNRELIGVVGMDFDFSIIEKEADNIHIYDDGYAFIVSEDGQIVHHPEYQYGKSMTEINKSLSPVIQKITAKEQDDKLIEYKLDGENKCLAYQSLRNGMSLCISVPKSEITKERDVLVRQNLFITFLIVCIASVAAVIFGGHLVRPLETLNKAAHKVLEGEWDITLQKTSNDEVGELTESFQRMLHYLNQHVNTISSLAYKDAMTGVRNKTAYREMQKKLEDKIKSKECQFAIALFDVNNLKKTNDKYGHAAGDELICCISKHICRIFAHSPVYRIGGDEFVALLETADLDCYNDLLNQFEEGLSGLSLKHCPDAPVSCAFGVARYDMETDQCFEDVFQRADDRMYQKKQQMKSRSRSDKTPPK